MKRFIALILALVLFIACSAVISATESPSDQPLCSDETGDYYLYEDGTVKAYVRLNQDAVYARFEGCWLRISDLDGNELILSYWFDFGEHPWLEDIISEYIRLNTTEDSTPPLAVPERWNDGPYWEMPVDEFFEDDIARELPTETGTTAEVTITSAVDFSNPSTGLSLTLIPTVAAAALAAICKKKR